MSYGVAWKMNDEPEYTGGLELMPHEIRLLGIGGGMPEARLDVRYHDLDALYLERCSPARTVWEPALILITHGGTGSRPAPLEGLGALHELADGVAYRRRQVA